MVDDLIIGMAGSGGDGIVSAGESLISAAAAEGYFAILTKSFGSQIRGGESSCRLRVSTRPVLNPGGTLSVAVVLNWEDFLKFGAELPVGANTVVVYETKTGVEPAVIPLGGVTPAVVFAAPMEAMALKAGTRILECPVCFYPRVGASKGGNVNNRIATRLGLRMLWGIFTNWKGFIHGR